MGIFRSAPVPYQPEDTTEIKTLKLAMALAHDEGDALHADQLKTQLVMAQRHNREARARDFIAEQMREKGSRA